MISMMLYHSFNFPLSMIQKPNWVEFGFEISVNIQFVAFVDTND